MEHTHTFSHLRSGSLLHVTVSVEGPHFLQNGKFCTFFFFFFFPVSLQPKLNLGRLIVEVFRSSTNRHTPGRASLN